MTTKPANSASSLAAVFTQPGQPMELRELPVPELRDGEALVRINCCTICGSDLHSCSGRRSVPAPTILGHEIVGVVEQVPDKALTDLRGETLQPGDRVVWSVAVSCGRCRNCRRGIPQKCADLHKYGHHKLEDAWSLSGGLAQHCHLRKNTAALKVDASLSDEVLCPASCATSTCAAALRTAGSIDGDRVLVLGAGMLGLTMAAMAKCAAADSVTVCDVNEQRRAMSLRFGADRVVAWNDLPAAASETSQANGGDGFDVVFEMTGQPEANHAAIDLAGTGARIVLVGSVFPGPHLLLDPERVVRRLLSIAGVHNYRPDDLLAAVEFLAGDGRQFPFAELVERSFALPDVNTAFQFAQEHRPIRTAVKP
ncbi:MAG: zinc-binding dehydrogenase [Planctomycetaceae bacterium]